MKTKNNKEVICKRCGHKWVYKGLKLDRPNKYPQFIGCPICRTSVKVR